MVSFFRDNPYLNPPPEVLCIWHTDDETINSGVDWIKGRGGKLTITDEKFPSEVTDFSTAIIKAKEATPPIDVLVLWLGDWSQVVTCFRQLQEYNWCPKAVGSIYNTAPSIITESLGEACYYRFYTPQPSENPELLNFYQTIMKKYQLATLQVGIPFNTWGGITTLFYAIERAGTLDSFKVAEAYRQLLQEGVYVFGVSYLYDLDYPGFYQELPAVAVQVPPYEQEGSTMYFKLVKSGKQWFPEVWKWPMPPWGK
jgi:ABC-type branched-subunit amino acid transport system substrate-binding protein